MSHYISHLSKDKKLHTLIVQHEPFTLKKEKNICLQLCASILSQQLSTKVAKVIYNRFLQLYKGKQPTAKEIIETPYESLRAIGLSHAKATYIHNVANFALENSMDIKVLKKMNDEEVITYLTAIKGVGRWTVEMILMFTLGREDVFSIGDLGIQQAMIKLYNLKADNKKQLYMAMEKIATKWMPYRTFACLHLWLWKDKK